MVSTKAETTPLRAMEAMPDNKSDHKDAIHAESGTQDIDALLDADTKNLTPGEAQQLIQALRKAAKDEHSKSNPRTSSGQYTPSGRPIASRFKSLREFDQALSKYKKNKAKEEEEFILIKNEDSCFFITAQHHEILINYHYALSCSKTWGGFWSSLSKEAKEFIAPFHDNDCSLTSDPTADCLIEDIQDDTWILSDEEFPVTQCAEETTSKYGNLFPREHLLKVVTTEYGEKIDLYNSRDIGTISEKVKRSGTGLTIEDPIFPVHIYDHQ